MCSQGTCHGTGGSENVAPIIMGILYNIPLLFASIFSICFDYACTYVLILPNGCFVGCASIINVELFVNWKYNDCKIPQGKTLEDFL